MKINTVIFDLDGTLLDTLGDLADATNWALNQLGYPAHPTEPYRYFVGNGARVLCQRALPEDARDEKTVERLRSLFDLRYRGHLFDRTVPYEGIPQLLDELKQEGFHLGVVSNKPDPFVQTIVGRYFPGIFEGVSGQQGKLTKPDPTGVNRLLALFGVSPDETLYVGDSCVDIQTAKNALTHSCGAAWGFRGEEELQREGAELIAHIPEEIHQFLRRT